MKKNVFLVQKQLSGQSFIREQTFDIYGGQPEEFVRKKSLRPIFCLFLRAVPFKMTMGEGVSQGHIGEGDVQISHQGEGQEFKHPSLLSSSHVPIYVETVIFTLHNLTFSL